MEIYRLAEGRLVMKDDELKLNIDCAFDPVRIPAQREEGLTIGEHILRISQEISGELTEAHLEKHSLYEGEMLFFYPNGAIKRSSFYLSNRLHGPSACYDEKGQLLALGWFLEGRHWGKNRCYYASGPLYSLQRYVNGALQGKQEYYYPDGSLKTVMEYDQGRLKEAILYSQHGFIERTVRNSIRQ